MLMIGKGPGMFGGETIYRSGSGSMTEIDPEGKTVKIKDKKTSETIGKIVDYAIVHLSYGKVTFTYEVDHKVYVKTIARPMRERYCKDQLIKVYYDPIHPKRAIFKAL